MHLVLRNPLYRPAAATLALLLLSLAAAAQSPAGNPAQNPAQNPASSPSQAAPSSPLAQPQAPPGQPKPAPVQTAASPAVPLTPEQQRNAQLAADTAKLQELAADLKAAMDKSTKDTLSFSVIKKAQEVEKLAHKVRDEMRASLLHGS
jgi:hypothetical protein